MARLGLIDCKTLVVRIVGLCSLMLASFPSALAGDQFTKPTSEELAMKELPGYPGVPAVILYREEITKDDLHVVQHYDRIKVLTEEGKRYANVELRYFSTSDGNAFGNGDDKTMGDVVGRTIHPDGTIVPFTGKPYKKTIEKTKGVKYQAIVFTLPDVEVGSIIEYRYASRINDNIYESPSWFIQGDLYMKAGHYQWFPTERQLLDSKQRAINSITWFPILPAGVTINRTEKPGGLFNTGSATYELNIKDVAPRLNEDYMPPLANYSYRVLFNFTSYKSINDFWKSEGKDWSKQIDNFANTNGDLKRATEGAIAGSTTSEQKLRKIYSAVMELENTSFTREHEQREDKASGVKNINSAADVLKLRRGSPKQLVDLFVGMARAAGFKAYAMALPDRSIEMFTPGWLSFEQFDATIAIVNVDGKEVYFDPGSRYCDYAHLAWEHTMVQGLRQTDSGTDFGQTGGDPYSANKTTRIADLKMDADGQITGGIVLTFYGAPALEWRQRALRGDIESVREALRYHLEAMLPKSLEVKVTNLDAIDAYDRPLTATYEVKGTIGTSTGKRLVLPIDLFEAGATATFPHDKRELPVYFHYPQTKQDAARIKFASGFEVEATPDAGKVTLSDHAAYTLSVDKGTNSVTARRTYVSGDVIVGTELFAALKKFYADFESKDKQSIVLKSVPVAAGLAPNAVGPSSTTKTP